MGPIEQAVSLRADRRAPVLFEPAVHLGKREVFSACQALADADRCLVRLGCSREAAAIGQLFELLEERLAAPGPG